MNKENALTELLNLIEKIIADDSITSDEVIFVQDWIDYYAVLFIGEEYNKIIVPLQTYVEDGVLSKIEIEKLYSVVKQLKG